MASRIGLVTTFISKAAVCRWILILLIADAITYRILELRSSKETRGCRNPMYWSFSLREYLNSEKPNAVPCKKSVRNPARALPVIWNLFVIIEGLLGEMFDSVLPLINSAQPSSQIELVVHSASAFRQI